MKNLIVMAGTGVGLFVATVVGLLGVQGRLNHEGTRGIPVLSALFPKPAGQDDEAETPDEGAETSEHDTTGVQHEGLGNQPDRLPYVQRSSLNAPADDGGHGGGHGGGQGAEPEKERKVLDPGSEQPDTQLLPPETEHQLQAESLLGQEKYRQGAYFSFPRLESGLTVDKINEILAKARQAEADSASRAAALDLRQKELDERQKDVEDMARAVHQQMVRVEDERTKLDQRIAEFQREVNIVRTADRPGLKSYATSLAAMDAKLAAEVILLAWANEQERQKYIKILALMDRDALTAILAEVDAPKIKELLDSQIAVGFEKK